MIEVDRSTLYVLDRPIATLDIETLSLSTNAIVDEIGVVVTNVLPSPNYASPPFDYSGIVRELHLATSMKHLVCNKYTWHLDVMEQLFLMERVVDKGTIRFRNKVDSLYHRYGGKEPSSTDIFDVKSVYEALSNVLTQVAEVWINHIDFDIVRLESLFAAFLDGRNLLQHRVAQDIATVKTFIRNSPEFHHITNFRSTPNEEQKELQQHIAVNDCFYNLWALGKARYGFHPDRLLKGTSR